MPSQQPLSPQGYRIGQAAARSGVSAANIRYYEAQGLLAAPARGGNQYRVYSRGDIHQLRFIRLCRAMDMSLDEVRTLLALDWRDKADCATAQRTLDDHLRHVRERLAELHQLQTRLTQLRQSCDGQGACCHIIEALHQQADAAPDALPDTPPNAQPATPRAALPAALPDGRTDAQPNAPLNT